jgi:hypothetical protein
MPCVSCGSSNKAEFSAEVNIHCPAVANLVGGQPRHAGIPEAFGLFGLRVFDISRLCNRTGVACKRCLEPLRSSTWEAGSDHSVVRHRIKMYFA